MYPQPQQPPVPYPSAVTVMAGMAPSSGAAAFHFFKGADWPMLVALFDPQTQQPLAIPPDTGFVADLYFASSPNPILTLTEDNGGVVAIDPLASTVLLLAPKALTVNAMPDGPAPLSNVPLTALPGYGGGRYVPPPRLDTRVVLWAISGAGVKQPVAVFIIGVGDLRSVDQAYFQENQAALGYGTVSQIVNANVLRGAQFKRGMEQVDPGSAQAMFESGVFQNNESDPGLITWRDDFAPTGGAFEQLYAQWLQLPAPAGRGMTPVQAAQRIAAVRLAAALL